MAYLGLVKNDGKELDAPGYHRIDLVYVHWGMTERHPDEGPEVAFGMINLTEFDFGPAEDHWPAVRLAYFQAEDDPHPICMQDNAHELCIKDRLVLLKGAVRFVLTNLKWIGGNPLPSPVPEERHYA